MADYIKLKPELFYAYSLLGNKKISKNEREINFSNLNKGFYDNLVNQDSEIRTSKDLLKQVKSNGIKESIYSNKPIPNTWKNKLGYYSELYKTMSEDKSLINYLGRTSQELTSKNKEEAQMPSSINKPSTTPVESYTSVGFNTSKFKIIQSSQVSSKRTSPPKSKKVLPTISSIMDDKQKQISSILEEYKTAYPIQLKSEGKTTLSQVIPTQTDSLSSKLHFPSTISKREVFKSTIYSNLIPDQANPLKQHMIIPPTKHHTLKKSTFGPFLSFDYDSYYKNIEISNPKIKKRLTELDYYGPYYSHCPSCRNKNLEFYETMEPNQCMKLLAQLKKTRVDSENKSHS